MARKPAQSAPESTEPPAPVPPGPLQLEVRINGKIVFLQRVHSYTIDQQDEYADVHCVLKLPVAPEPVTYSNVAESSTAASAPVEDGNDGQ